MGFMDFGSLLPEFIFMYKAVTPQYRYRTRLRAQTE